VLALLALVAFPVFAHAAGIPQYEVGEEETHINREPVKPKPSEGQSSSGTGTHKKATGSDVEEMNSSEEPGEEDESSHSGAGKSNSEGGGPSAGEGASGEKSGGGSKAEGKNNCYNDDKEDADRETILNDQMKGVTKKDCSLFHGIGFAIMP